MSGGRLELGIGRGAYPYEFARMAGGIPPEIAREQLGELLPALRGLWAGDYAHDGTMWKFPSSTSTPRPLDPAGPPLWVSARHPDVFRLAVENRANLMVAPLMKGFEEVVSLRERVDAATAEVDNGFVPEMMVLRNTYVSAEGEDLTAAAEAYRRDSGTFENLYSTNGKVEQGWVEYIDPSISESRSEYTVEKILENLVFGTSAEVVEQLRAYEEVGTDVYLYDASLGMSLEEELASIRRFGAEVIPHYATAKEN
ncbi:LLM class flavin-dependent oxidoreductase [Leucobacter soli]|uniref:LLM class flavin-dependent oxidoreductase n=1 Tax=Leucobacter soli TaxID=2812850 RepID=UPI00360FD12C